MAPEKRVVACRREEVAGHVHITGVKLADGTMVATADVVQEIQAHAAHYTMIPPEGAPAYRAWQETGLPLEIQTRQCPDCADTVLFA